MTAQSYAVSRMSPSRRLRTGSARQSTQTRQGARNGTGPAAVQRAYRPYEPVRKRRTVRNDGSSLGGTSSSHRGTPRCAPGTRSVFARRRALRRARRLAALLVLAALLGGFLAMQGFAPGAAAPRPGAAPADVSIPIQGSLTLLMQKPALPNGCETVSLAMLLDWAGCPADPVELFGGYIPHEPFQYLGSERYGPDPETAYAGDAASARNGWYCFEGPVVEGANAYLAAYGSDRRAQAVTGLDEEGLLRYLDAGIPLAVWVTQGYEPPCTKNFAWILPDGSQYTPYNNLHCVVLAGRGENGQYRIADPLNGWQAVDPDLFWQSFDAMGRRAIVIEAANG